MPTPTQAGIVNAALAELGSTARIGGFDDDTPLAADARAIWDSTLRDLLADHPWNWAIARTQLNAGAAPEFGYAFGYTIPSDCLRWLPPGLDEDVYFTAAEEGGRLLTDSEAPLRIRYISALQGERMAYWPPKFVRAMELALAARLAEPVTQDESIKRDMEAKAEEALRKAKRKDGLASNGRDRSSVTLRSDWLMARDNRYNRWAR